MKTEIINELKNIVRFMHVTVGDEIVIEQGKFYLNNLEKGIYSFTQIETPDGKKVLNSDVYEFDLKG